MKKTLVMNQKGVAAVEFALVLPILLLLVFGIIEFSVILYNKAMITNASREGARAGIAYNFDPNANSLDEGEIEGIVMDYLQEYLINFGGVSNALVSTTGAQGFEGSPLTVTVNYQYDYLVLPNFARGLTNGLNLSGRTIMRME